MKTIFERPVTGFGPALMAMFCATILAPDILQAADVRTQWCAEAQAAVESWLRADTNNLFTPKYGKFVRLEGSGYQWPPVWNIQGYDYITLHRTGHFADGTIPIKIYVTEGAVTAPGQTNLGIPVLDGPVTDAQGAGIFISHPKVGKGVKSEAQTENGPARQSQSGLQQWEQEKLKREQFDKAVQRWGDEAMTAVENFLKAGSNEISAVCGDFVCFEDDGSAHYQIFTGKEVSRFGGHSYITIYNARALFSGGYLRLNIYITEGKAVSPRLVGMGAPTIQGGILTGQTSLVVPHPELCSLEDFQGQDSLSYLKTDGETKLVGTYKLQSSNSASDEPCTLELRADHTLIVSNCPTPGDPQRRVAISGNWSLSTYQGLRVIFQLSVNGGDKVKLRSATCNLLYPPMPGGFRSMVTLTLQDTSGVRGDYGFIADKGMLPFNPLGNPHFVRRKPTGNPPNWDTPIFNNPETQLRNAINSRLKTYGNEDVAMQRARLAELLYRRGALTEAETEAREGLAGLRKRFRDQTIYVPNAWHTLAQILQAQGRLPEAEAAFREELTLKQKLWQPEDPRVVEAVSNLSQVLKLQGKSTE